jgi:cytochrome c5
LWPRARRGRKATEEQAAQEEQVTVLRTLVTGIVRRWHTAPAAAVAVPARKNAGLGAAASVQRGRDLFYGSVANCIKCHGESALGDGTTTDYDDWVKDLYDPAKDLNREKQSEFLREACCRQERQAPKSADGCIAAACVRSTSTGGSRTARGHAHARRADETRGRPQRQGPVPDDIWDRELRAIAAGRADQQPAAAASEAENPRITP